MEKKLDADPKAIQQIEFDGQLTNVDGINAAGTQNMFLLTILEKIKETKLKFSQGRVTVLKDGNLSRSESYANKYTIKQIKICSKK